MAGFISCALLEDDLHSAQRQRKEGSWSCEASGSPGQVKTCSMTGSRAGGGDKTEVTSDFSLPSGSSVKAPLSQTLTDWWKTSKRRKLFSGSQTFTLSSVLQRTTLLILQRSCTLCLFSFLRLRLTCCFGCQCMWSGVRGQRLKGGAGQRGERRGGDLHQPAWNTLQANQPFYKHTWCTSGSLQGRSDTHSGIYTLWDKHTENNKKHQHLVSSWQDVRPTSGWMQRHILAFYQKQLLKWE